MLWIGRDTTGVFRSHNLEDAFPKDGMESWERAEDVLAERNDLRARLATAEKEAEEARKTLADRRVVVPELTEEAAAEIAVKWGRAGLFSTRRMLIETYSLATSRARALSPDEVTVRREELEALESVAYAAEVFRSGPWPEGGMPAALNALANAAVGLKALRSQGEAGQ